MAGRPGPGARGSLPGGPDRAVRPRAGAAASASHPRRAGESRRARPAATARAILRDEPRPVARGARLELRRRLVARQRPALDRDDRARVETRVHPHQRDAGLGVAGQDRRRDRRRAPVARQERGVDVQRRRSGRSRSSARHELAVVGEDDQLRLEGADRRDRLRAAQIRRRSGRRRTPSSRARAAIGVRRRTCRRGPAGRSGAVTTPTSSTSGEPASRRRRIGTANPPLPRKIALGRSAPGRVGHARAFAASSASSSSPWPTGISSSIESR